MNYYKKFIFIKKGSNIRSASTGKIITTSKFPIYFEGTSSRNNIYFTYKGQRAYVNYTLIDMTNSYSDRFETYISSEANIRYRESGEVAFVLGKGEKVSGYLDKNRLIIYDPYTGNDYYVDQSLITDKSDKKNGYLSANTNVRLLRNDIMIRVGNKGEYVQGEINGMISI